MGSAFSASKGVSVWMNAVGGIVLFCMMMLTVIDVILRFFGRPITGTYELVAVAGAIVVGFAVPQTTQERGHICVEFLVENRTVSTKRVLFFLTRLLGIVLFALLTWYLFLKGSHLYRSGDVSMTLHLPYYPAAFALALCCLVECFVLVMDCLNALGKGEAHE